MDFALENTIIIPVVSSNKNVNNKTAICFYHMTIVNKNPFSTTIKNVEAFARIGKSWHKTTLCNVKTGKLKNGIDAVILSNGQENVVMMRWKNLHAEICQQDPLPNGGVLKGSAVFMLDVEINKTRDISKVKILISDYLRRRSVKYVRIEEGTFDAMNKNFKIVDKEFTQINDETFEWRDE